MSRNYCPDYVIHAQCPRRFSARWYIVCSTHTCVGGRWIRSLLLCEAEGIWVQILWREKDNDNEYMYHHRHMLGKAWSTAWYMWIYPFRWIIATGSISQDEWVLHPLGMHMCGQVHRTCTLHKCILTEGSIRGECTANGEIWKSGIIWGCAFMLPW